MFIAHHCSAWIHLERFFSFGLLILVFHDLGAVFSVAESATSKIIPCWTWVKDVASWQQEIGPASIPKWSHQRCHSDATEMLLWNCVATAHCRSPKCHTEVGENSPLNHGTQFMCEFELSSKWHVAAWAGENSPSCLKRLRRSPRNGFKFMPLHALP